MFFGPILTPRAGRWLVLSAFVVPFLASGCGHAPLGGRPTAPAGLVGADLGPQNSVKALIKAIKAKLEEHTAIHGVVMTDVQVLPSVIWNLFNVDGTLEETVYQSGVYTYQVVGTYDVLTKEVELTEKTLISVTPLSASSNASAFAPGSPHSR